MWKRHVLRPYSVLPVILIGLSGPAAFAVGELPQTFTLDGQLSKVGTDDPLLDASATIVVQVLDPSKTCLLYEERQFINTTATEGYYSIQIGSNTGAAKRTVNDPGLTMIQIFQNRSALTANSAPGETCAGGTYTPTAADSRYFRLIVTPSATSVADTLSPDTLMDSVPNALVAETLQGLVPNQFLQTGTGDLSQANVQSIFAAGNTAKLTTLLSVNPSNYVTKDSTNGTIQIPAASTPGTPLAGQIWYDSGALKFWNGTAEQILGIQGSGTVAVANGGTGVTSLPGTFVLNGGQAGAVTLGPSDANSLTLNTSGTAKMTILSGGGNVGIGTTAPQSILDVNGTTTQSAMIVPRDTTANRPTPVNGMIRYNTTTAAIEAYADSTWSSMPQVVATVAATGQNATIPLTTLFTPPTDGHYQIYCTTIVVVAATTSSTLPTCRVTYTEADTNTNSTQTLTTANTGNNVGAGASINSGNPFFYAKGGTAIQFSTSAYASSGATAMQFNLRIKLVRLP